MNARNPSVIRTLLVALLAVLGTSAPSAAATIGFVPGNTAPAPGESFAVDVVISGLGGETVSAYDLDIVFDPAVLSVDFVSQAEVLGDAALFEALYDAVTAPGLVDVAGLSLLPDPALQLLQDGDTVTLATIGFTASGSGSTTLDFVFDATNDVKGLDARILDLDVAPAQAGEVIPEPAAAVNFGAGLLLAALATRRRTRRTLRR